MFFFSQKLFDYFIFGQINLIRVIFWLDCLNCFLTVFEFLCKFEKKMLVSHTKIECQQKTVTKKEKNYKNIKKA